MRAKKRGARAHNLNTRKMPTTALHAAAQAGHLNIVQLLLKKGANPHVKDQNSRTASQLARVNGHVEVADCLVRAEAATAQLVLRELKPVSISVNADDVRRILWSRAISPHVAHAGFVRSFNIALRDHGEAARAAAAHRRERHDGRHDRPVTFTVDCGEGDDGF